MPSRPLRHSLTDFGGAVIHHRDAFPHGILSGVYATVRSLPLDAADRTRHTRRGYNAYRAIGTNEDGVITAVAVN